jgi:predicted O-methyltransferase YrrM
MSKNWGIIKRSLLSNDEERLKQLIKKLRNERFNKYITHSYFSYLFRLSAKLLNGEIVPNFTLELIKKKIEDKKTKDRRSPEQSSKDIRSPERSSKNIVALEIGSFQGLGAKFMVKEFEDLGLNPKVHCVDLMYNYYEEISKFNYSVQAIHLLENTEPERRTGKIFLHSGRSSEVLPILDLKADFIYVDGEHTSGGVYLDLVMSLNQIDKYGIIVIDDVDWYDTDKNSTMPGIKLFLKDYGKQGLGAIDSMYSLSKNKNDTEYFLHEDDGGNIYKMKTKQLLLIVKHYENNISKDDVKAKGLYFS